MQTKAAAPTTPAPPTTVFKTSCLSTQYLQVNGTCATCGGGLANGTCVTASASIVGGRCNGAGACIGTQGEPAHDAWHVRVSERHLSEQHFLLGLAVTLCSGASSSTPCPLNPGKFESYCDTVTINDAALYAAVKAGGETGSMPYFNAHANPEP